MTPKQKAEQIYKEFHKMLPLEHVANRFAAYNHAETTRLAALFTVNEVLKVASCHNDTQAEVIYWEQVYQEIRKL